jgi:hypothetical protein
MDSSDQENTWKVFVPNGTGFKQVSGNLGIGSANSITIALGYHPHQVFSYWGNTEANHKILFVLFEIFTSNIIAISTRHNVTGISKADLTDFLQDFTEEPMFDGYKVNDLLTDAVEDKSLKADYLGRVLDIPNIESDGVFTAEKIGMYLYFNNGILTDFQPSDGLNEWAKQWKQIHPGLIEAYEKVAKKYWGDNVKQVLKEVNVQSAAVASIPGGFTNPYIKLHRGEYDTINFVMLSVCHHDEKITEAEFKNLNHGRYQLVHKNGGLPTYQLGKFTYTFLPNGMLDEVSQIIN